MQKEFNIKEAIESVRLYTGKKYSKPETYTDARKIYAWIGFVSLFVIPFLLYELHALLNATV